jgi:hypothetical protein
VDPGGGVQCGDDVIAGVSVDPEDILIVFSDDRHQRFA